MSFIAWLQSRFTKRKIADIGLDPNVRMLAGIEFAFQDETPTLLRIDDIHAGRKQCEDASTQQIVAASSITGNVKDFATVKILQVSQSFEYAFSYPLDADDDTMQIVLIGGKILDMLQNIRSTKAVDIAQAMTIASTTSRSDLSEYQCRVATLDSPAHIIVERIHVSLFMLLQHVNTFDVPTDV